MGPRPEDVFAPLASIVLGADSFDSILQQVVELACSGIGGCTMAAITLLDRGGPTTAASTSAVAARVDAVQYRLNSGPCLEAYRRQVVIRILSTGVDDRWSAFCQGAIAEGVQSSLSFPLIVNGDGIGALNLYSGVESGFSEADERIGGLFASHASVTLANARTYWQTETLRQHLETALEHRAVIEQAKGVLMAREGFTADEAFDALKRASQRENRKVHDLAEELVGRMVRRQPRHRPRAVRAPTELDQ